MKLAVAAALAASGCDYLLGLHSFADANTYPVTGEYRFAVAVETPAATPDLVLEDPPADFGELDATLLDGTHLDVTRTGGATFSFVAPEGATYSLVLQLKTQSTAIEYFSDSPTFALRNSIYDRPDAVLATQPTPVTVHATVPAGCTPFLESIGVRSHNVLTGDPSNATIDWHTIQAGAGTGALISAAKNDRLVFECRRDNGTYMYVAESELETVEMTDGMPLMIGNTTPIVPPAPVYDRCVHLTAPCGTELARITSMTRSTMSPGAGWAIASATTTELAPARLLILVGSDLNPGPDATVDVSYRSPFAGEIDLAFFGVNAARPLAIGTASPYLLYSGSGLFAPVAPSTSCPGPAVTLADPVVALYTSGTLGDTPLASDGQNVTIDRSRRVPFAFELSAGSYEDLLVTLFEVSVDLGATRLRVLRAMFRDQPLFPIDPSLLVQGHYYVLQIQARVGFRNAHALDYTSYTFPGGNTTAFTTMFRIAN